MHYLLLYDVGPDYLPATAPAHDDFGQILDSDGTVLLCLHEWGAHEHLSLRGGLWLRDARLRTLFPWCG